LSYRAFLWFLWLQIDNDTNEKKLRKAEISLTTCASPFLKIGEIIRERENFVNVTLEECYKQGQQKPRNESAGFLKRATYYDDDN
jgi:hypothetical protein